MRLLCWNVRGMGGARTFRDLKDFIFVHKPELVFLIETKMTKDQMGKLKTRLGMDGVLCVGRDEEYGGARGGLCFLWRSSIAVSYISSSFYFLNVMVTWEDGKKSRVTGFYGHPETAQRESSWDLLRLLKGEPNTPWLCCGDFNEILDFTEKTGFVIRSQRQIDAFRRAIEDCGLYEFAFTGFEFTWDNRREGEANVKERLDRGFGNLPLIQQWGGLSCHHLVALTSDHNPILIEEDPPFNSREVRRRGRRFLFEEVWLTHEDCGIIVEGTWTRVANATVSQKLGFIARDLKSWGKEKFGNVRRQVSTLREELDELQRLYPTADVLLKRNEIGGQLDRVLETEEILWRQRSRVTWLKCGDRNTRFFHQFAKHRGKVNRINGILGEDNRWRSNVEEIGNVFVSYFRNLFTTGGGVMNEQIFETVHSRVPAELMDQLNQPFTSGEIEAALKSMNPTKSPGPDGLPAVFYQKFWGIVGQDVLDVCLNFLNGNGTVAEINNSLITLIPKVQEPKKVTEYRPISLCNVLYKLISKTLANRLKCVLPEVISETQSAFVSQRLIHDNTTAAFEIIHCLKRRGKKSRQKVAVKLDMAKAYDRVEWDFLRRMMEVMGFPGRFISLIMDCVQTVSYSVLLHGAPFGRIKPSRGLRQGDPISPYLFLLVAEGFSSLIRWAEQQKMVHGVAIARGAPSVSHLFFADDSLLFCDATVWDCVNLKKIFCMYEEASGQKINREKSAMAFSPKTMRCMQVACSNALDMPIVPCHERYLGLPTMTGRGKKTLFRSLADRVWKKVTGWEGKLLSKAGKEVLIKSVAQAIPNYTMSIFQLPIGICEEINRCLARYWWGKSGGKGIHWRRWEGLCTSKDEGGLGFRDLVHFNQALLDLNGFRVTYSDGAPLALVVADLFNDAGLWNIQLLDQLVGAQEKEAILKIPLARTTKPDLCIWNYCKNGRYTVKSGHWLARKEAREGPVNNVNNAPGKFWKHLWKLKVPPKMKHFLWRCAMGFIPTMEALHWKRITQTAICFRCHQEIETPVHATWRCGECVAVFERAAFFSKLSTGQFPSFIEFFYYAMETLEEEELQLLVFLLWWNWYERNSLYHNGTSLSSEMVFEKGVQQVSEWRATVIRRNVIEEGFVFGRLNGCDGLRVHGETLHGSTVNGWQPPERGKLKLNCDGAASPNAGHYGVGFIVRNAT
ncbi:uncharacterized protein LOC133730414 [Rosa rugosa]|uniref:uncharacterized protein LOC133730414 n=1 Tax=Rosa rugosa TaxID=74645 RepID=UPI002B409FB6|nr:uncharacterized protein LOC133730414 [Rosa rugosa]